MCLMACDRSDPAILTVKCEYDQRYFNRYQWYALHTGVSNYSPPHILIPRIVFGNFLAVFSTLSRYWYSNDKWECYCMTV